MSVAELSAFVGRTMTYTAVEDMLINVVVFDAKSAYGRVRLLIAPVSGAGRKWVDTSNLTDGSTPTPKEAKRG